MSTTEPLISFILSGMAAFSVSLTLLLALWLDRWLGEPRRFHHLIGFGWLAQKIERCLNPPNLHQKPLRRSRSLVLRGALSWLLLVLPLPIFYYFILSDLPIYWQVLLDSLILYLAIGLTSLEQHAMQVFRPLQQDNLRQARHFTGYLVSRKTKQLSPQEMARATVESMLENGHDGVIASLIYYLIGGIPLVIAHRLANTLDAMWGYKTAQFYSFGYASARADDLLGFVTGKCSTLLYALQRPSCPSIKNAYRQGNQYKSHNGGWVIAAGATVMAISLGGRAIYHGQTVLSVTLGAGREVCVDDIPRSISLVKRASALLLGLVITYQALWLALS